MPNKDIFLSLNFISAVSLGQYLPRQVAYTSREMLLTCTVSYFEGVPSIFSILLSLFH